MKRWLAILLLLTQLAFAQGVPVTSQGFNLPPFGYPHWDVQVNNNFSLLDNIITGQQSIPFLDFAFLSKIVSTLPAASASTGRVYRVADGQTATDCIIGGGSTSVLCTSNGSVWQALGSSNSATTTQNWVQPSTTALAANTPATVTLTPCPIGVDTTSGAGYQTYINDANPEAVQITGGTCASGATSGTVTFTPFFAHTSYLIGSASSGIQETINLACGTSGTLFTNIQCRVSLAANGPYISCCNNHSLNDYNVYGTIYFHANQSKFIGDGVVLNCVGRAACLQVGDLINSNNFNNNTVRGFSFAYPSILTKPDITSTAFAGSAITNTQATGSFKVITTAAAHNFRPGDWVTMLFTDNSMYWGDAQVVDCGTVGGAAVCNGASTSFRIASTLTIASQATPGVVALDYVAILDNAMSSHFVDIQNSYVANWPVFNNFFDVWDDENMTIDHFNNTAVSMNQGPNWTSSYVFSGGAANLAAGHQLAPVISLLNSNITANSSNGVTVYNSNGLYIENTVIQASGLWDVYCSGVRGNFKACDIKNKYGEGPATTSNPAGGGVTPWPGLGGAGLISASASLPVTISGSSGFSGYLPTGGAGATPYTYYIVVNDTTVPSHSSPMPILNWASTGSDSIPVKWPRIANGADVITYDVIRMTTAASVGDAYPSNGACPGGAGGICGSVATGISQATACSGTLVCSFTDSGSASTTAYTIQQGTYSGQLNFWPGSLVVEVGSAQVELEQVGPVVGIGLGGNPLQVAKECTQFGQTGPGGYTSCLTSFNTANNGIKNQAATLMTDGPSNTSDHPLMTKGRLNFPQSPYTQFGPHHIITLQDSQPALTEATIGYRPAASANDVYIGTDQPIGPQTSGQLSFGAPVAISGYIGNTGNNTSWLFRLTSSAFTLHTPLVASNGMSGLLTTLGTAPTCAFTSGGGTTPSCSLRTGSNNESGTIISTTGTGAPAGTGTITLTFNSSPFGTNSPNCIYGASDGAAGQWNGLAVMKDKTPSTSTDLFTWTNGTTPTALTVSTAYWINYHCVAY